MGEVIRTLGVILFPKIKIFGFINGVDNVK